MFSVSTILLEFQSYEKQLKEQNKTRTISQKRKNAPLHFVFK